MPWAAIARIAVIALLVGALVLLAAWLGQRALVYHPDQATPPLPEGVVEVALRTDDGLDLTAWELAPDAAADRETAVLVAPGNAGNRGDRIGLGQSLAAEGFTVLLLEYRGYGGNPGSPAEEGLAQDAAAAWDHLRTRFAAERILLFGESLGAGVAAALAAQVDPGGLVLRSPFTDLAAVGQKHYPILPVGLLLRDEFAVTEHLAGNEAPVVVIYSESDEVVPAGQSRAVADAAESAGTPVTVVAVEASGHNDPALVQGPEVIDGVAALADRLGLTSGR
ncbi:alpha/beta fold hydrolase [Glycomyces sp. TRM65418]|uniref:alpha/beta hydrolase n=1 Tax=Glycomyces sp. TRM65418 TaxID=2867006 RepID=UPI001CE66ECF|nr:alpha/beta fold hydrolase [Glycomyces sp. TRM65418]MCC3761708.1 alpha/beta fold hydrolase [Glycomyces sp. TRM65418]QZD55797.1 alpha/beta fold hydrolase [Glycomyces sp. TRM65418]